MTTGILVVDQVLVTVPATVDKEALTDYALSMVFANASARPVRKDAASPEDGATAFHTRWSNMLGQSGWLISAAGDAMLSMSSAGQTVTIAERLTQLGGSSAVKDAVAALKSLETPEDDQAIAAAEMWWQAATAQPLMQATLGTLSKGSDGLTMDVMSFTIDLSDLEVPKEGFFHHGGKKFMPTSIADLFTPVLESSLDITTGQMTASLQPDIIAERRGQLRKALGNKFADHYAAKPADLL